MYMLCMCMCMYLYLRPPTSDLLPPTSYLLAVVSARGVLDRVVPPVFACLRTYVLSPHSSNFIQLCMGGYS